MEIAIIGVGRMGGALALALAEKGHTIKYLVARNSAAAREIAAAIKPSPTILTPAATRKISGAEIIFITTQDSEIKAAAANLAANLNYRPTIFHASGSLSSEILKSLKDIGCAVGSLHPLVSVSDARLGSTRFAGAYFCVEGDAKAVSAAEKIVADLGGKSFSVTAKFKPLYHAAAVTASGHLVALVSFAVEMLAACGLENSDAQKVLLPLIKSTVENLARQTPAESLTGTFARADVATLRRHLEILRENVSGEAFEVYLQLGARSLHLAEERGADAGRIAAMRREISMAKSRLR